jgi:putative effector of murein hydrolase
MHHARGKFFFIYEFIHSIRRTRHAPILINNGCAFTVHVYILNLVGKFWDAYTQGPDILEFHLGPGITALGAPPHKLGSPSSMPGPMRMKLPTVVHHI